MKTNKTNEPEQPGFELSDEDLEQVSGGFNPQPDPPAKAWKLSARLASISQPLTPGALISVHKPG